MKNKQFHIVSILILIAILHNLPLLASSGTRQRDCLNNIRVLTSAVEKYNNDHSNKMETAIPGYQYEEIEKQLIKEGYLKDILFHTENDCSYGFIKVNASETFFCKKHGTTNKQIFEDKRLYPQYDTRLEQPFSNDYSLKQSKYQKSKKDLDYYKIFNNLLMYYPIHTIIVFIIVIYIVGNILSTILKPIIKLIKLFLR